MDISYVVKMICPSETKNRRLTDRKLYGITSQPYGQGIEFKLLGGSERLFLITDGSARDQLDAVIVAASPHDVYMYIC